MSIAAVARRVGASRAAISDWLRDPVAALADRSSDYCFVCGTRPCPHPKAYAYLLGQYLGDGYLVTSARIPRLRISCADSYPGIAGEVDSAMSTLSGNVTGAVQNIGCS